MLTAIVFLITVCFCINFDVGSAQIFRNFSGRGCLIDVDPIFSNDGPIVVEIPTSLVYFPIDPHEPRLRFDYGETVEITCPSTTVILRTEDTGLTTIKATCKDEEGETNYAWNEINCQGIVRGDIYDTTDLCAGGGGWFYDVAFEIHDAIYTDVYKICYSPVFFAPLYTYHNITILRRGDYIDEGNDPAAIETDMLWVYDIEQQKETINKALGLDLDSTKYINSNYLVPKFLVPKYDFYYTAHRNSIYKSENSIPMWKSVKEGNWAGIENEIREFVAEENDTLNVWTGTYGNLSLAGINEDSKAEIYLNSKNDTGEKLTVPALFWKVIYDDRRISGIVFLTINNPYYNNLSELIICPDISQYSGWFGWGDSRNSTAGFSYACDLTDFGDVVTYLPDVNSDNILLRYRTSVGSV